MGFSTLPIIFSYHPTRAYVILGFWEPEPAPGGSGLSWRWASAKAWRRTVRCVGECPTTRASPYLRTRALLGNPPPSNRHQIHYYLLLLSLRGGWHSFPCQTTIRFTLSPHPEPFPQAPKGGGVLTYYICHKKTNPNRPKTLHDCSGNPDFSWVGLTDNDRPHDLKPHPPIPPGQGGVKEE